MFTGSFPPQSSLIPVCNVHWIFSSSIQSHTRLQCSLGFSPLNPVSYPSAMFIGVFLLNPVSYPPVMFTGVYLFPLNPVSYPSVMFFVSPPPPPRSPVSYPSAMFTFPPTYPPTARYSGAYFGTEGYKMAWSILNPWDNIGLGQIIPGCKMALEGGYSVQLHRYCKVRH